MITIVARCVVKSGMIDEFCEVASSLVNCSRKENGCYSYKLFQDINEPNIVSFIEEWESQVAIDAHNNSVHYNKAVASMGNLLAEPIVVDLYKNII
ncbi:MAG: putative quinol monooxygenase [Lentisphaeria bacterium]